MADTSHEELEPKPRRQPDDRRSARVRRTAPERRQGERRRGHLGAPAGAKPRKGQRRKSRDRRVLFDRRQHRRRDLPAPYSSEEVLRIHRMFQIQGHRGDCPACGGRFIVFASRRRGNDTVRKVECRGCGKGAVVTNSWVARVLIVIGAEATRQDVRSLLASAGHEVDEAPDADTALRAYRDNPADVVMVDMSPTAGLDGAAFIRRLRADFADAVVLAAGPRTTYGAADPLAAARQHGAADIIRAPFSTADLLAAITAMIRAHSR